MFKFNTTKFFIYCALIFGIVLIGIIPPFQSPDEDSHFKKAYVIAHGKFYPTSQNGVVGFYMPEDMIGFISEKLSYAGNRDKKYLYSEMILDDRLPKDYTKQVFHNFSTAEVTPIAHIAPAIGIVFSKIVEGIIGLEKFSAVNMLYFARFFSLILYIVIIAFSIKITPILKKTFCLIALMPMSLALASAVSYDSVIMATVMFAIALIFKLIFDDNVKKVNYKYIIAFGIIGFILLSIKTVYITALFPLIFVPKEKYDNSIKKAVKYVAMIGGIVLGIYVLNKIPSFFLQRSVEINTAVAEQKDIVINYPIYYLKIFFNTLYVSRNFFYTGIFGMFGLTDTYVITAYTAIYSLTFLLVGISDVSLLEKKFDWKYKLVTFVGVSFSIFAMFLAMYLYWTSIVGGFGVGSTIITGVQGRYFLPLMLMIFVLFSNKILAKNEKIKLILNKILENSYLVSFGALLVSSISIFLRFWC